MKGGSYPLGEQSHMKGATSGKKLRAAKEATDWERLHNMSDVEVHAAIEADPEAHPTDEAFWEDAEVVLPRRKELVTMRLDADLLEWLRQEPGYQTKINAILRTYMKAKQRDRHIA